MLSKYLNGLIAKASENLKTIVLPEGEEERVLKAAHIIADANARLMGCAGPTNILTFPGDGSLPGELLLSLDTWERECRLYRQPPLSHLLRLLAHGMAHMTGLDHGPEMAALEQLCLQSLPESIPIRAIA